MVGGGYGELAWTQREYALAQPRRTRADRLRLYRLEAGPDSSAWTVLQHQPRAIMLSFGDPRPYAARLQAAGVELLFQVQRVEQGGMALEAARRCSSARAAKLAAHGMDAWQRPGHHHAVPGTADWLPPHSPKTLLLARRRLRWRRWLQRGCRRDGRCVGSRLWATQEILCAPPRSSWQVLTNGDGTARSSVFDILRRKNWPAPYDFRAIRNARIANGGPAGAESFEAARAEYDAGVEGGDSPAPMPSGRGAA